MSAIAHQGPCDACWTRSTAHNIHNLHITGCGRALCRGCDCGGDCYDRHIPGCDPCTENSNLEVARQMTDKAKVSMNLLETHLRWA